jgi:hypothetical protein
MWCEVLQDNGKDVEEVLCEEENEWLLADDWRDIFFERTGYSPDVNDWESDDESESSFETGDEDQEDATDG